MSTPFDASFVYTGPLSDEVKAAHAREIESARFMAGKLANGKLHAGNELQRCITVCNRLVWGEVPADLREPNQAEIAALLEQAPPEARERLLKDAKAAAEARHLIALFCEAQIEAQQRLEEKARAEQEKALRAAFEASDAAGKEARWRAWLAAR